VRAGLVAEAESWRGLAPPRTLVQINRILSEMDMGLEMYMWRRHWSMNLAGVSGLPEKSESEIAAICQCTHNGRHWARPNSFTSEQRHCVV